MFADVEKGCYEHEDVVASVCCVRVCACVWVCSLVFRWFQLFVDRLVCSTTRRTTALNLLSFVQVYYESNLDAFPGSLKERKSVALKRITGSATLLY